MKTTNENFLMSNTVWQNVLSEMHKRKKFTDADVDKIVNESVQFDCPAIVIDENHQIIFPFHGKYAKKYGISQREGILMTDTLQEIEFDIGDLENFFSGDDLDQTHQLVCFKGDLRTLKSYQTHVFMFDDIFFLQLMDLFS